MRTRSGRLWIGAAAVIVQLAVLVLAHDLVYLARYGSRYGEALIHSGHGDGWRAAAATSILLAGGAALIAVGRLVRLHILVRRERAAGTPGRLMHGALLRTWLRIGPALAISTVVLLTVQENMEQHALHGVWAGMGILLTPEYAGALWIAFAVGLVIGAIVALVAWRFQVLLGRLRAARAAGAPSRAPRAARPASIVDRPITSILGRRSALRAPPVLHPAS
jgi:hypothetical protein